MAKQRGQSLSYMIKMVNHSKFVLLLTVEFCAGSQLEQSVIHLMPSLGVSQMMV